MSHDVIDNRDQKLVDHIRTILQGSECGKFAVGYFFLSGLEAVADVLEGVKELRLLIGSVSNRATVEQMAEGYRRLEQIADAAEAAANPKRSEMAAAAQATATDIGRSAEVLDQTDEAERLCRVLVSLIENNKLKVRVYTRGRLHAKAYIFDYGPVYDAQGRPMPREEKGIAIVGSSNFTLAGVQANTELNVVVHGNDNHADLTRWFEDLWGEATEFAPQLMEELRQSWPLAAVTPYEIYLKTLYELVVDRLDGAPSEEFLWRDDITAVLADFQEQAVRRAIQMIRRHGGCFVSDVVGLGKSYIGAAVVKHFERHDRARPLIICPAPLVTMWEHYNEAYRLNARVLSMGALTYDDGYGAEWMLHDERYATRDFVLVDESHNFRNPTSQRYKVLESYLDGGDRSCVFLTATPQNQSAWDIYHQIHLFHQRDLTDIPIDPPNLRRYFDLVEDHERRLPALLAQILIRRTRQHVLRWYGYDAETGQRVDPDNFAAYRSGARRAYVVVAGKHQFFPKRELSTVSYSIEATYAGLYEQLRAHLGQPHSPGEHAGPHELTYARYGLWNYVKPAKRNHAPYNEIKRAGANLRGLVRIMLFKRFESSVYAFRQTVTRLLRIHRDFLVALEHGVVPAGEQAQSMLYESDLEEDDELLDALAAISVRYDINDFNVDALKADLGQDIGILEAMLAIIDPIGPAEDAKLQTLKELVAQPDVAAGKRLIFTQYADTAQYLHENLNPHGVRRDVDVIYSRNKSKAEIVGRFAPAANPQHRPPPGVPIIDTLVATDVLSEGLNLQDCDKVINYDLHWNPVRLIQRFGRIDRIGTTYDRIWAYNFLPETALEAQLGLREKLSRRIREIHQTIGEDAAILETNEELNEEAMYTIYEAGDLSQYEDDEVDDFVDLNEAEEIVRQLREDQPDVYRRIIELRDGVRCGRQLGQEGAIVLCRAGDYRQLYHVDQAGEVLSRDIPHILSVLRCEPDTPAEPLPAGYNSLVSGVKRSFDSEVEARRSERRHTISLTKAQQYVRRELRVLYAQAQDVDLRGQIGVLDNVFAQPALRPMLRAELSRLHRERLTGMGLLDALSGLYGAFGLDAAQTARADGSGDAEDSLPRIICSEALLP